ncbi:hypothetical protein L596_015742 [Steinernema carpocapsae]|uniref:Uncharacterized protein n=1 Tax=Steinernema carpocapsae TaxID=34508 RepID=A0A4U5NFV9_STECR|nr:hypothetical protein L596_015742 [Steinernema carpocapsae]
MTVDSFQHRQTCQTLKDFPMKFSLKKAAIGVGVGVGAGVGVAIGVPLLVGALGFGAGGIAAGSTAAWMMSLGGAVATTVGTAGVVSAAEAFFEDESDGED